MSSQSPRRLLPKVEEGKAPSEPVQLAKKRKLALIACARCRSHKTRCDGNRPSCGMCRARNVECTYDDDPNTTTAANLRRQYHCLAEQHQSFHELFEMLRSRPEEEALAILRHFRSSGTVQSTLQYIKEGYLVTATHMAGSDADEIPLPPCPKNREEFMLGIDHPNAYPFLPPLEELKSSLGFQMRMIPEADPKTANWVTEEEIENARHLDRARELDDERLLHVKAADWTTVTSNDIIVQNLISLYLSWDHATMRLFDEEFFIDQISNSKTEYCSPVFVNAVLAAATLNYSAIDKELCKDLGHRFYEEACQLWKSDSQQRSHLLSATTATLLSMWCYGNGDEKTGTQFSDESIRIGIDLGLFRTLPRAPPLCDNFTRRMIRGEAIVAWGLFNWESVHSFFRRRDLRLPNPPYHPTLYDSESYDFCEVVWNSFPFSRPTQHIHRDLTFLAFSELWAILWEASKLPRNHVDLKDVDASYGKCKSTQAQLLSWSDRLPPELVQSPESLPSTLDLHQFFHAIMVQLFRAFASFDFPRQAEAKTVTQASMSQMRRLVYTQRYRYDGPPFSSATVGSVHVFTSSLLEELAKASDVDGHARFYLVLAAEEMKRCGESFPFTHKILHQLLSKARSDGTQLPADLDTMFDDLEARLLGHDRLEVFPQHYPIVFRMGISGHDGGDRDDLVDATYNLRLGN
ncbi:hypothetical protein PG991_009348 [Apiospora marii]|uniref:Zn(2)-C6 fungal-type domain-containing protein n=1 Tax=Apiospora marii TaxID=335849 RepID=A0ABR1RKD6_9PEZI